MYNKQMETLLIYHNQVEKVKEQLKYKSNEKINQTNRKLQSLWSRLHGIYTDFSSMGKQLSRNSIQR